MDEAKPGYPPMMWKDNKGNEIFVIKGAGSSFSST